MGITLRAKSAITTFTGAALFVDVSGFSSLARSLAHSDAESAADQLMTTLNAYFLQLMSRLHARGAEVLLFAGDAVVAFIGAAAGRTLREAAALAVEAARDVRAIAFERSRHRLTAHTGVGAGELHLYLLRGSARAAQALYAGGLIEQVCEALRATSGDEIVLSAEAYALLQPACPAQRLPPAAAAASRGDLYRLEAPAGRPRAGRRRQRARRGVRLLLLAPPAAAGGAGAALLAHDIRTVFAVFASFPELDGAEQLPGPEAEAQQHEAAATARHAARFGQVVRSVHRVAEEFGGSVNKIMLDEKGASAIIGFGLPGGFAHEDDAERAVRAALALQTWFRESAAPFACGIAAGRTFCGTLGAPCRKEYALIGDSVILAARLMGKAREAIGAGGEEGAAPGAPLQEVLCDQSIVTGVAARGRSTAVSFEALPPALLKGFPEAVPVFRPGPGPLGAKEGVPSPVHSSRRPSVASDGARGLVPGAAAQRHPAALVGRDVELQRAAEAVEALAARGRGSTLVVEAEAGMGKTRLLREVRRACAARGVLILSSAASAVEEATPLWALRGLVASVADASSEEALRADLERRRLLAPPDASLLWENLFAAGAQAPALGPQPDTSGVLGRSSYRQMETRTGRSAAFVGVGLVTRLAAALARLIWGLECSRAGGAGRGGRGAEAAAGPARVCLLLEDAHWMDSVSWFVVRCIRDSCPSLLLVITARPMADPPRDYLLLSGQLADPAGSPAGPPGALPRAADRDARAAEHALDSPKSGAKAAAARRLFESPPPPAASAAQLEPDGSVPGHGGLSSTMSLAWPPGAVDRVLDKAAGVPLFLVELCRQHAVSGPSRRRPRRGLPSSRRAQIQQIVLARVDRLPSEAQAVLKLLAVAGSDFSCEQALAADPSGLGAPAVRRAFRTLCRAGLIAVRPPSPAPRRPPRAAADGRRRPGRAGGGRLGAGGLERGRGGVDADEGSARSFGPSDEDEDEAGEGGPAAWPAPQQPFCFLHALLRDAVYAATPSGVRWGCTPASPAGSRTAAPTTPPPSRCTGARRASTSAACRTSSGRRGRRGAPTRCARRAASSASSPPPSTTSSSAAPPPSRPSPPRSGPRRHAAGRVGARRRSSVAPARGAAEVARWRAARAGALRYIAFAENWSASFAAAGEAAEACLLTLGEPMPRSRIGPAAALGILLRVWRAAGRVGKAPKRGSHWLHAPEHGEAREALLEALLILVWTGLSSGSFGGRGGFPWVALALVRAYELSEGTPGERLGVADCRVMANFASVLHAMGLREPAAALLAQSRGLAEALRSDAARAAVENHAGMQHCNAGDLVPGGGGLASPQPNNHELLVAAAVLHVLTGRLAEAARCSDEAAVFASRLGVDAYGAAFSAGVGAIAAAFVGRDEAAAALLRQSDRGHDYRWWAAETQRALRCLLAWRAGDVEAALAHAEACAATWRAQKATFAWFGLVMAAVVVEFSLWARARARERAALTEGPRLLCWRRGPRRASVAPRRAARAAPPAAGPGPARGGGGALRRAERLAGACRRCSRSRAGGGCPPSPLRRARPRRAARARPAPSPRPPARRRGRLRAPRPAPLRDRARLRLARAERGPGAAAEALAAALRLEAETGVRVAALGRPAPPPGVFETMWV
eukprot:tig00000870_g5124.t1